MKMPDRFRVESPPLAAGKTDKLEVDLSKEDYLAGKKIAIFIQSLAVGGAERMALHLIKGLIRQGIQVDLLLANCSGGFLSEVPPQVTIIDLKGKRVIFSLFPLVRYLRKSRPDLLYSIQTHTSLIAVWAVRLAQVHIPLVISIHNMLSTQLAAMPSIRTRIIIKLASWFLGSAEAAICVSQGLADDFIKNTRMPPQKTHVVYNPVVFSGLEQAAREPISHPWFSHDDQLVILAVGRLVVQKDYPTLLRAFSIVNNERPVRLLILGDGQERTRLEVLIEELGISDYVQMPGFVLNPYAYMARARLLVLSSRWEGLPTVIVEALACGTPVVSTDCKSGPSEILADGRFGRLVPVGDAEALAAVILETLLITPDRALLRERAQDFTLEKSVKEYLRIFRSCLLSHE